MLMLIKGKRICGCCCSLREGVCVAAAEARCICFQTNQKGLEDQKGLEYATRTIHPFSEGPGRYREDVSYLNSA